MADDFYYPNFMLEGRLIDIVEPELQTCETLAMVLKIEGMRASFSFNLDAFFALFERRRPDLVIANFDLGGEGDGLILLRRLKSLRLPLPVIMIENRPAVDAAVSAVKAGAADVLTKPVDTQLLLRLVRDALREDVHLGLPVGGRRAVEVRGFAQLTPREREVLQLITNGQSNKEAGRELGISPRTIEVHRARVMEKLGARNTADLMRIVLTG
jgi:FixJ family two-component response regulator